MKNLAAPMAGARPVEVEVEREILADLNLLALDLLRPAPARPAVSHTGETSWQTTH
jgi:hypothetical protein